MGRNGPIFFYSEQNFVTEHFLVGTISKVHLEAMEQTSPNRIAITPP
jgi:hypothetical protein